MCVDCRIQGAGMCPVPLARARKGMEYTPPPAWRPGCGAACLRLPGWLCRWTLALRLRPASPPRQRPPEDGRPRGVERRLEERHAGVTKLAERSLLNCRLEACRRFQGWFRNLEERQY